MKVTLWIDEQTVGPFDLYQISSMYQSGLISGVTQARNGEDAWQPLVEMIPSLTLVLTNAELLRHIAAAAAAQRSQAEKGDKRVSLTNIDLPFNRMIEFMIKWAIATIPAAILLLGLGFALSLLFGGFLSLLR